MKTKPFLLLASVILLSCSQSEEHLTESGLDPNAFYRLHSRATPLPYLF